MIKPRCVIDTNVLISAALSSKGLPNRVITHILEAGTLLVSNDTIAELETRLARPKFERYISRERGKAFVELIRRRSEVVEITVIVKDCIDPDDNMFLALALDGQADVIISGDKKHLLPLHPYQGIPILSPRAYLEAAQLL